jgi:beta-glucanase (GH16 family)
MPKFLKTRKGSPTIAIAICDRCREKTFYDELSPDVNTPGLRVCMKCADELDPYRLEPRQVEKITLRYPRPETPFDLTVAQSGESVEDAPGSVILPDGSSSSPPPEEDEVEVVVVLPTVEPLPPVVFPAAAAPPPVYVPPPDEDAVTPQPSEPDPTPPPLGEGDSVPTPTPIPAEPDPTPTLPSTLVSLYSGDMAFREEFAGSELRTEYWQPTMPFESESSSTTPYRNANFSQKNWDIFDGKLRIWPQTYNGEFYRKTFSTSGKFWLKNGIWEARLKLPRGKGCWPAFWLLNSDAFQGSPIPRPEIDIMEAYPGGGPNSGWSTADLRPNNFGYTVWDSNGANGPGTLLGAWKLTDISAPITLDDQFHTFTVVVRQGRIRMFFDGVELGAEITAGSMDYRFYIILDLWYGSASGAPNTTETPQGSGNAFEIDYVYAWKLKDGSSVVTGTGPLYEPGAPPLLEYSLVTPEFWGMHLSAPRHEPYPPATIGFKTLRLWDIWPAISWTDINTSAGVYDWTEMDAHMTNLAGRGLDFVYTFGYVPLWVTGSATAMPTEQAWTDFVTAIVTRFSATIKYWEIWNEPNEVNFWTGTAAQMARLAELAAPIIRNAGCKVLSPAPQGSNSYLWFDEFLLAGGGAHYDITAFHSYTFEAPETLIEDMNNLRTTLISHSQQSKPIWDTEGSWGDDTWPFGLSDDLKKAYLARFKLLSFSLDIERSIWYAYDNFDWGKLADRTTDTLYPAGEAYAVFYTWINDRNLSDYYVSGTVFYTNVTATGFNGRIIWDTSGNSSYVIPTGQGFNRTRTLEGVATEVSEGSTITIGIKPILIDNGGAGTASEPEPTPDPGQPQVYPFGQNSSLYTLPTFWEEFEGSTLNTNKWNTAIWYQQPHSTINYRVVDGSLKIWPMDPFVNRTIDTDFKYYQRYGFFEMEAKLNRGRGVWPAFWIFAHPGNDRPEIDIMEAYPGGGPSGGWGTSDLRPINFAATVWRNAGVNAGHNKMTDYMSAIDLSAAFHKYGCKWDSGGCTFYFDGVQMGPKISVSLPYDMYILLDLWFGSASGTPNTSETPQGEGNSFEVKYVRAWQFK